MSSIFPLINKFVLSLKDVYLGDITDKCHYIISCGLFAIFSLFIGSWLTVGEPLNCIVPTEFSATWIKYVQSYCFVDRIYIKNITKMYLDDENGQEPNPEDYINYYQWIPLILAFQSLLFYLPHAFWCYLQKRSDIDFGHVIDMCLKARSSASEERQKLVQDVASCTYMYCSQLNLCFTTIVYLVSKSLNLANVFTQLLFINYLFGNGRWNWGLEILRNSWEGISWRETTYFPRFGFCSVDMHMYLGQSNTRELQCALIVNVYNEKVFTIAYFWLIFLTICTLINAFYSSTIYIVSFSRVSYGNGLMKRSKLGGQKVSDYVTNVLGIDGILLLRFIEYHAGTTIASEIAHQVYSLAYSTKTGNGSGFHTQIPLNSQKNKNCGLTFEKEIEV